MITANETKAWLKKIQKKGVIFKIDFEMAQDSIRWDFWELLTQFRFGETMITWLMGCVTSASISILVNGSPTEPFPMHKGLGQGDYISSFLFTLVCEALNFVIMQARVI